MRPSARAAGDAARRFAVRSATWALAGAALLSAGCAQLLQDREELAACADTVRPLAAVPLATWRNGPSADAAGGSIALIHPGQIAVSGDDLFVADQGLGQLLRVQRGAQTFRAIARLPGRVTGMVVDPFRKLFLAVPSISAVLQVSAEGATERVIRDAAELGTPVDVAVDRGQSLFAADGSDARVIVFDRLGQHTAALGERLDAASPFATVNAVAAGARGVYVLDATLRRVHLYRDGRALGSLALGADVRAPAALAVDRWDRVFVLDAGAGRVLVLTGIMSQAPVEVSNLGVTQPILDIWVDEMGDLYTAEPGAVRSFRLPAPCAG